jgi:nitrogen fixation protein FixH
MQRASDKYIPYYFIIFFTVIILIDSFLVYLALSTWRGVVVEEAYQEGVAYNKVLDQVKVQDQLGWHGTIEFEQQKSSSGKVQFTLTDNNNNPITKGVVKAKIMNVFQDGKDFEQTLKIDSGKFIADLNFPMPGKWMIRVYVDLDGEHYQIGKKVVVY